MWLIRRHRPSSLYCSVVLMLLIIALYLTMKDAELTGGLSSTLLDLAMGVNATPVEYLRIDLDLLSQQATCQHDDRLLVYILSSINNFQRREVVRSTWASKQNGTCFVFVTGEVPGLMRDAGQLQMRVNQEKRAYGDVVQINHIETYANVVFKEVAALQWSQRFYPNISYLFKTDDDLIVDTLLLGLMANLLATGSSPANSFVLKFNPLLVSNLLSSDRQSFFRGAWSMEYQPTLRGSHKFSVNETVWPHPFLPPYCSGFGWFMAKEVRDKLVLASHTYPLSKVVWIGDVFASGFLARAAKVRCTRLPISYDQPLAGNCSCLMASDPVLTVCSTSFHFGIARTDEEKYDEYRKAWRVIRLRHSLASMGTLDC